MTKNEAPWDRTLRVAAGLGLLALNFTGPRSLWGLVGLIPLTTGLVGYCPVYRMLGVSTCETTSGGPKTA